MLAFLQKQWSRLTLAAALALILGIKPQVFVGDSASKQKVSESAVVASTHQNLRYLPDFPQNSPLQRVPNHETQLNSDAVVNANVTADRAGVADNELVKPAIANSAVKSQTTSVSPPYSKPLTRPQNRSDRPTSAVSAQLTDDKPFEELAAPASKTTVPKFDRNRRLALVQFEGVSLADAMKLFSEQAGVNVITSADAGKTPVTVYLKNVTAMAALEAIVKANGLFYRIDDNSGIIRIATSREYEKDLASFREEETKVFTLLYPNPYAVAQVIQQVFGDRVQFSTADGDMTELMDLSQRFNRFDLVDGRSLGLGTTASLGGGNNASTGNPLNGNLGLNNNLFNNGLNGGTGAGGINGNPWMGGLSNRSRARNTNPENKPMRDLTSEDIQRIENQIANNGELTEEERANLLQKREATIFVSTIRKNNQIIVRSGDSRSMAQIEQLIKQLDVPTPTVMLEVKVLRVVLGDGFHSAFEYFSGNTASAGAFSDGSLTPTFPNASSASRVIGAGLGVAGAVPGSLTYQLVDDKFQFRMQLLQSQNRVTALATPLILTANNEVSRIFVGDTLPFTVGFTPSQIVASTNAVNGAVSATPITELRDIGQSLLITPNINADRTVTLRVVEENSERVLGGASIPVPASNGSGINNVNVDTVRRRTVSGTVVAQDCMAVALGGLIEEHVSDARDQVPVLGSIPGIGFLFRRQATDRARSELIVVIRPYVFNTPSESAATSHLLLSELSLHPNSPEVAGVMDAYLPCNVVRPDPECCERAKLFRFHNVVVGVKD